MHLRTAAIFCFLAALGAIGGSISNALALIFHAGVNRTNLWAIPFLVLLACVTAIAPIFYYALYRDGGSMHFPRQLRKLALAAAVVVIVVLAANIRVTSDPANWKSILNNVAELAYIGLLFTMSRDSGIKPAPPVSPSNLLRRITKLALIVCAASVALQSLRLAGVWLTYSRFQQLALGLRHAPPSLPELEIPIVIGIFSQASLLAAPLIVWLSDFGRVKGEE